MTQTPAETGRYHMTQIMLHWATVLLILVQYLFHDPVIAAFDVAVKFGRTLPDPGAALHMVSGLLIFGLTVARLLLRRRHGVPPYGAAVPHWQRRMAQVVHSLIYATLLLLPLGGIMAWATTSRFVASLHSIGAQTLMLLLLLHVAGALFGQYVARRGTMDRMRPV